MSSLSAAVSDNTNDTTSDNTEYIPHDITMRHASTLAIKQDKPIMMDYYVYSRQKQCRLVKTQDNDTILYKSNEEYTSPLKKLFKIDASQGTDGCDIIAISENSIYVVHSNLMNNK